MKNIFILTCHDFAQSLRNKSFYLILFIPLFVFVSQQLLDETSGDAHVFKIALIQSENYNPLIIQTLQEAKKNFELTWVQTEEQGRTLLKEHSVEGVLTAIEPKSEGLTLVVLRKESPQTLVFVQVFATLQKMAEKNNASWISEVKSLKEERLQKQTFGTWVLMLVLLVGFIILPGQVADEKEKKLILALLQTPMTENQWLTSKIIFGILLCLISVLLLATLSQFLRDIPLIAIGFIALGGYCFGAFGVFLGLLCRHQAAARTLGLIFYLPLLLPSALSDFSKKLTVAAPFLPSYQFYSPLHGVLFEGITARQLEFSSLYLFILGSALLGLSHLLIRKRWLM